MAGRVAGCVFYSPWVGVGNGFALDHRADGPSYALEVEDNTFFTQTPFELRFGPQTAEATAAAGKLGRVRLTGNVFAGRTSAVAHSTRPEWNLLAADAAFPLYPQVFDWGERGNVYAADVQFFLTLVNGTRVKTDPEINTPVEWQR